MNLIIIPIITAVIAICGCFCSYYCIHQAEPRRRKYIDNKINKINKTPSQNLYNQQDCTICLENLSDIENNTKITQLSCEHIFHKQCIQRWLYINTTCPICKICIFE